MDKATYDSLIAELNALMDKAKSTSEALTVEEEKRIKELEQKIIGLGTSEISGIPTAVESLRILKNQGWPSVKSIRLMQGLVEVSDSITALYKAHQLVLDELANIQTDVAKLTKDVEDLKKTSGVTP